MDSKPPEGRLLVTSPLAAVYAPSPDSATGHILFMREQTLLAQPFDPSRQELRGEPVPIAEGVGAYIGYGDFSASSNGVLIYRKGDANTTGSRLTWFDRAGKEISSVGAANYYGLSLSPDGTRVAFSKNEAGNQDIWVIDLARNTNTRFTSNPLVDSAPVWSPDGMRIAFARNSGAGGGGLFQKLSSGLGAEEQLLQDSSNYTIWDWSRDGRYLLFGKLAPGTVNKTSLQLLPMDHPASRDRKPSPLLGTQFSETDGQFSPDGRWVAYASDESGRYEIYVQPFSPASSGGIKTKISEGGGRYPRWRRDGKELFYITGSTTTNSQQLMAVEATTSPAFNAGIPKPLFRTNTSAYAGSHFDVSADGKRFLIENAASSSAAEEPITVVTNWQAGLKK
jgi:eukaryotic-like serine/threonine-protein kinase